jgi:IrrE N-terminal-like domain
VPIRAPYLPYDKLRAVAGEFLATYHAARSIPVPIDAIIETRFKMDIVPTPGLKEFDIEASISNDLSTIYVDEIVWKKYPSRYRFSVAHELAHRLIHADIFKQLKYESIGEWKQVMQSIPVDQYRYIELQAYGLGGLILVPGGELKAAFQKAEEEAAAAGFDLQSASSEARRIVESSIARDFCVSHEVIKRRLKFDELW